MMRFSSSSAVLAASFIGGLGGIGNRAIAADVVPNVVVSAPGPARAEATPESAVPPASAASAVNIGPPPHADAMSQGLTVTTIEPLPTAPGLPDPADRVLAGVADCEFRQHVGVQRVADQPGTFLVTFGKARYTMTLDETTTGAVRLSDKSTGVVWLQIPVKSMLLDTRSGHRLVDACQQAEQLAAARAAQKTVAANDLQ